MPALTQTLGNIGKTPFLWRSFQPSGVVAKEDRIFIPADFASVSGAGIGEGNGNLDISKIKSFLKGSLLPVEEMRAIRLRATLIGGPIAENDVRQAFLAYCEQLKKRKVVYHYNADHSPFDVNYKGESNCQGRAKGFLQLMAVLGVPKEQLNFLKIGGGHEDADKKICQKGDADIDVENLYKLPGVEVPAPNALRIELKLKKPVAVLTAREPFANHYATCLDVFGLGTKYWDPLERVAYRNGFPDYFTTYQKDPLLSGALKNWDVECLSNPDEKKERIYLLPSASKLRALLSKSATKTVGKSDAFYDQPAFKAVEKALAKMTTGDPQISMIVDKSDWTGDTGDHPPVIYAMFPGLE